MLESQKEVLMSRFVSLGKRMPPRKMTVKESEAYRLGLKQGYGEGLKDGVNLGVDVGMKVSEPEEDFDTDCVS
jgi:hypothetical protein